MAGYGKNTRYGKRPASSGSSSCSSTVTMVIFVAFCLFGVWMLTTSTIIPSQSTTTTASRATDSFARKKPPLMDDSNQITVDEDSRAEPEVGTGESTDNQDQQQQQPNNVDTDESPRKDEETQQDEGANAGGGGVIGDDRREAEEETQLQQQQQQGTVEERQDLGTGGQEDQQETQTQQEQEVMQQRSVMDGEDRQEDTQQQQTDAQSNEIKMETQQQREERIEGEEKQIETERQQQELQILNNSENHQETQEQQQQTETEIDENHDRMQQQIEEEVGGSRQQSDEGGTDAQLQVQSDTEGSGNQQQQDDPSQQQTEEKLTGGSNAGDSLSGGSNAIETITDGSQSDATNESDKKNKSWKTQADESQNEKERRMGEENQSNMGNESGSNIVTLDKYDWELCNVTAGPDYIPCLDNEKAIKQLHGFHHYEHRERHCPEEGPTCLVPLPKGYKRSIEWPKSREQIWYNNVPHTKLAEVKGHQNWVKVTGQFLLFPGGGTQFIHGALHYIDFLQQSVHDIAWGKHTRVILDVGCGVASFGGYLFERDVLAMSFAPKDEHEAQVQFALERGIPAISAVMGSQRLQFPSRVFDLVHCARCRVPWHADGGTLLLELNRVLRPGGFFVWSATPVYQKLKEDVEIWKAMKSLTIAMCWDLVTIKKDKLNGVGAAFFRKPVSNDCYDNRKHHSPPMCKEDDDPNAAWYIPLKPCMHRVPVASSERGSQWPEEWPRRLQVPPYWLNSSQIGVYGKPAPQDFTSDYEHWKQVVTKSYLTSLGIDWPKVRNVMDMRAVYGGFAAALRDLKVWVMNVVNIDSPDTLPIIYERGFFGIYHDWCESFSTYPRTYDLLHADHLFSQLKSRCKIEPVMTEIDRILRPGGKLIVRDESSMVGVVENILKSLHWEVRLTFSKDQGVLCAEKSNWRPEKFSDSS